MSLLPAMAVHQQHHVNTDHLRLNCVNLTHQKASKYIFTLTIASASVPAANTACKIFTQSPKGELQGNNNPFAMNANAGIRCREGRLGELLNNLYGSDQQGVPTYISLLQVCENMKALAEGKQVHAHLLSTGFGQNAILGAKLVSMYSVCGSVSDARLVFDKILNRNVSLWNAMLRGYVRNSLSEEAITLYYQMQETAIQPDNYTFPCVLNACAGICDLQRGKEIHDDVIKSGLESDVFVGNALIDMYTKCGSTDVARHLFDKMSQRDGVSWNSMIAGYAQNEQAQEALKLFLQMQLAGVKPSSSSVPCVLRACARLAALQQGKQIHGFVLRSGLESDAFVGSSLVDMYAKCGSICNAHNAFDKMSPGDVVSWNTMIAGYSQNGYSDEALNLFYQMQLAGVKPNRITVVSVLPACAHLATLRRGKEIHGYVIKNGFDSYDSVGSALIATYAKTGYIEVARRLFDKSSKRNVVSWNAMIAGYNQNGHAHNALTLFREMQLASVKPNSVTIISVLLACAHLVALKQGKEIHDYIIRSGFESDVCVGNALVTMYAKCICINFAQQVFNKIPQKNVVSWNAIIAGYAHNGHPNKAFKVFNQMQQTSLKPNLVTITTVLSACADLADLQQGKYIHDYIIRNDFDLDVFVVNALIDMYAKCHNIEVARQVFDKMSERNIVSWNTMIVGYVQNGHANEALKLACQMQMAGMKANLVTITSTLSACAHIAALQQGKVIHAYIIRSGFESDVFAGTALIDMYAKCGSVEFAYKVFNKIIQKNVVSWNTMIAAYGMHGQGENAVMLYDQMQQAGVKPDSITFVALLSACSHAGLINEGWQYFHTSQDYGVIPRVEHYACMVDLLGRAGHLDDAHEFIKTMPLEPDAGVWGALLGGCKIHCNTELGQLVAEELLKLEPENDGNYVLISNVYAAAGRWDGVAKMRKMMKDKGLKKRPGCSWIEFNNKVHVFFVGDRSHPQSKKIYAMLEALTGKMVEAGYVPDTSSVLQDVKEDEKEYILCSHSERLAVAFGLINICPGTPIRITKNLRVCDDCHTATKFISKIVGRKITLRDANRFHHFKDGICSCGDYW